MFPSDNTYDAKDTNSEGNITAEAHIPSLKLCLKQPVFLTHCAWFSFLHLKSAYFLGSLNGYLNRSLSYDKEQGNFDVSHDKLFAFFFKLMKILLDDKEFLKDRSFNSKGDLLSEDTLRYYQNLAKRQHDQMQNVCQYYM